MNRRTVIAGIGAAGLAGLSGCLGLLGMDEHESSPAGVEADAREETGYDQTAIEELRVEEEFSVGPVSETVSAINYMTKHEKAVDMGPLGSRRGAVYNVLTTPQVEILGREFNPVEEMSTKELVDLVRENYDGIDDISHDEDTDVTILEQSTTQSRFTATAEFDGRSVDVYVYVTEAVEADDDLLVTIGVYPQRVEMQEDANIRTLTEAVTTEVDESASTDGSADEDGNESSDDSGSKNESGDKSDDNESDDGVLG